MKLTPALDLLCRLTVAVILTFLFIYATKGYVPGGVAEKIETAENFFQSTIATKEPREPVKLAPPRVSSESKVARFADAIVSKYRTVSHQEAVHYARAAVYEGTRQGVDPALVLAVCSIESSFNPKIISGHDHGLMQVNTTWQKEATAEAGGPKGLLIPKRNIHAGTKVLYTFIEMSDGDERRGLRRYNGLGKANNYPEKVLAERNYFALAANG